MFWRDIRNKFNISVKQLTDLTLPVITKAHSLTNTGNSHLIVPQTPSIYLLLTRLPLLFSMSLISTLYLQNYFSTLTSLSLVSLFIPLMPPIQNK